MIVIPNLIVGCISAGLFYTPKNKDKLYKIKENGEEEVHMVGLFEAFVWLNLIPWFCIILNLGTICHHVKAREEEWNRMLAEHRQKWTQL